MTLDTMPIPATLPAAVAERTALARQLRADPAMQALAEGFSVLDATGDFDCAFRSSVTLRRIEDRAGRPALQAYEAAVRKIEANLEAPRDE